MAQHFVQDPSEAVEYQLTWASVLPDSVTIVASEWEGAPLTLSDEALEGDFTAVLVSEGVKGKVYQVKNTVTLTNGETYIDSIFITFEEK